MRLPLRAQLPAHPGTPGKARRLLTDWLRDGQCAIDTTEDLVLAVNEAVTNTVEHAYPPGHDGTVDLDATAEDTEQGETQAVVTVTDTGGWRPPPADPGFRGRGLAMIEALVGRLHIRHSSGGTQVRMTGRPCNHSDSDNC